MQLEGLAPLELAPNWVSCFCVTQYYVHDERSYDVGDAERIVCDARFACVGIDEEYERDADGMTDGDGNESRPLVEEVGQKYSEYP